MQLRKNKEARKGNGPSDDDSPENIPTAANKSALRQLHEMMNELKEDEEQEEEQEEKKEQDDKRTRRICYCGDPSCGIGPFTNVKE